LIDEKITLASGVADKKSDLTAVEGKITLSEGDLNAAKNNQFTEQNSLTNIRARYKAAKDAPLDDTCYACGHSLTGDKKVEVETARADSLKVIADHGQKTQAIVKEWQTKFEAAEADLKELAIQLGFATAAFQEAEKAQVKRLAEIATLIEQSSTKPPETDDIWMSLTSQIANATVNIGEPVNDQLTTLNNQREPIQEEINKLVASLAQADRMKKDKVRIEELEQNEQDLTQKLADIEKQLEDISKYNAAFSTMIEKSVNTKFKHVTFKMFNTLLNGSLEDCCEAMLNGVTFADLSKGQEIFIGIDIVNVLAEHYDISVPLFVDGAESLTLPIEANSQVIELHAVKGVKKMKVESP
jgi:chromosome segregation ATPase